LKFFFGECFHSFEPVNLMKHQSQAVSRIWGQILPGPKGKMPRTFAVRGISQSRFWVCCLVASPHSIYPATIVRPSIVAGISLVPFPVTLLESVAKDLLVLTFVSE
jgi:hypothetical protein